MSTMINEFVHCFKNSNYIFILPVFSAGEKKIKHIESTFFYEKLRKKYSYKKVYLSEPNKSFFDTLKKKMTPGNNIIFLGAGVSSKTAYQFKNFFKKEC